MTGLKERLFKLLDKTPIIVKIDKVQLLQRIGAQITQQLEICHLMKSLSPIPML